MADPSSDEVDEHQWDEACQRADVIREFLQHKAPGSESSNVDNLSAELGLSRATTYRVSFLQQN
jgi:putative transposase